MTSRKSAPPFRPMDFLDPDTDYKWKVDAVNASGGASSDVFSFRTTRDVVRYQRGNANADATTDISDAIFMLGFLFLGGRPPTCEKTLDVNDDGRKDISDAVNLLNHLFLGGLRPAPPFRECSEDPTEDDLDCESFAAC